MIYLLSDLHESTNFKALNDYLSEDHSNDLLIILGDIGLKFRDTEENEKFTQYFLSIKCPVAFIDGNHENYQYIYSYPVEEWNGGLVHRLSENIVHLMRGQTYDINGKSFFAFGGCKSSEKWKAEGLWYPEEEATEEEYEYAYENLKKRNNKVDYILTHKYCIDRHDPYLVQGLFNLTKFIDKNVDFKYWYFGHSHQIYKVDDRHECVYNIPVVIE
jgi:predicted phosphodiesterase